MLAMGGPPLCSRFLCRQQETAKWNKTKFPTSESPEPPGGNRCVNKQLQGRVTDANVEVLQGGGSTICELSEDREVKNRDWTARAKSALQKVSLFRKMEWSAAGLSAERLGKVWACSINVSQWNNKAIHSKCCKTARTTSMASKKSE